MRRLRLDKRSIAPSQPTARCALSLVRTAWEAGSVQGAVPDLSPAPRSLGWAEPARRLKRVGPRCERGAQRLLWLQSARDAGDPEGWSLRLALKRRSSETAIHLRGRAPAAGDKRPFTTRRVDVEVYSNIRTPQPNRDPPGHQLAE
ncbi:uncharacterized protein LOC116082753 [Mastomys coucha]|uniref:uncharacterized protein LOC116082753 n=1 Tax=Mastomys coucha TaxID=35658 RepID=UPI0012623971|nr:uncharacterized protein LOC116082753 [Mastomys coucha]